MSIIIFSGISNIDCFQFIRTYKANAYYRTLQLSNKSFEPLRTTNMYTLSSVTFRINTSLQSNANYGSQPNQTAVNSLLSVLILFHHRLTVWDYTAKAMTLYSVNKIQWHKILPNKYIIFQTTTKHHSRKHHSITYTTAINAFGKIIVC
jgi:hypothetical protein